MSQDLHPANAQDALTGLRVLDLTGPSATFTTKLLADLGADVVRIEPPGGDPARRQGPFYRDRPHPEGSLPFFLNNTNKRSITLNLETADGRLLFEELVRGADVVVETFPPSHLDALGIGYGALASSAPGLVWTAVTPFGQTGPYAHFKGSDLTGQAMGGAMFLTGEPGKTPVRAGGNVADKMSGYTAAAATMFALYHREVTGAGQFVDVSVEDAVASQLEWFTSTYIYTGEVAQRNGSIHPTAFPVGLYPCADGWISIVSGRDHQWRALGEWIGDERLLQEKYFDGPERAKDRDFLYALISDWTSDKPKQYLFHEAQRRRIPIGACLTPSEVVSDPHLNANGYFVEVEHAHLGTVRMPGAPYAFAKTPWRLRRPAPLVGEHNPEIYAEIGLSAGDLEDLRALGVI